MPFLQEPYRWRDCSAGIVGRVDAALAPRSSVPFAMNVTFDEQLGSATVRDGYAALATLSDGNRVRGLHSFRDADGSGHRLWAVANGNIYNGATGAAEVTGLSATAEAFFASFLDTTLMLNGGAARTSEGGGSWDSSGGNLDAGNVPSGAKYPIEWHDRMYCAVTDRLYYTATPTSPSVQAVSWSASGSGSIQIEREDGGGVITQLAKVPGYLLIFKERSLKRWNFDSTFPDDLVNLGTQASRSPVMAGGNCYFFSAPQGFYATNGGYPKRISRPIQHLVDAIPSASYSAIAGWSDNRHVYWSIGDLTVDFGDGLTEDYANVVVRYSLDTQEWAAFRYARELTCGARYVSGSSETLVAGTTDGRTITLNSGTSDDGTAITAILQSPDIDFGYPERGKTIGEKVVIHSLRATAAELQVRADYGSWRSIGSVRGNVCEAPVNLSGNTFSFRIVHSSTGASARLIGLDFPKVEVHESPYGGPAR